jgi:hypothetical protein
MAFSTAPRTGYNICLRPATGNILHLCGTLVALRHHPALDPVDNLKDV